MSRIVEALTQWLGTDRVSALAERVAGRSRLGVWQRVKDRLPGLAPNEARGYLRARTIGVVQDQTTQLIEQEGRGIAAYRAEIEEAAIQLLINMICAQVSQRRAQAEPRQAA
jgi:hypothetical protein